MTPLARRYWDNARRPTFVYEVYDSAGEPVYVGQTGNLADRLRQHQGTPMWREVAEVHSRLYPTRDDAQGVEAQRIRELQPRWNFQNTERASASARERHAQRHADA